jgi:hypothetical protein
MGAPRCLAQVSEEWTTKNVVFTKQHAAFFSPIHTSFSVVLGPTRLPTFLSSSRMTTAHKPTFHPAVGSENTGGFRHIVPLRQVSARDLASHTTLKFRSSGQNAVGDIQSRDLRAELADRERKHQDMHTQSTYRLFRGGPHCSTVHGCVFDFATLQYACMCVDVVAFTERVDVCGVCVWQINADRVFYKQV